MFERFTDDARMVIVHAQEECILLGHRQIGTEHLLLGLLHEHGDGQATGTVGVLAASGVTLESARRTVADVYAAGVEEVSGYIPFTPRAKRALEQSLRVVVRTGRSHVTAAHLLLGLLEVRKAGAVQVLRALDVDLDQLKAAVERIADQPQPEAEPEAEPDSRSGTDDPERAVPVEGATAYVHRLTQERDLLAQALRRYGRHEPGCDPGHGCSCGLGDLLALAAED